jgi:hypothetical protein
LKSGEPFAFAGLWERWDRVEPALEACTILTTSANKMMQALHVRMPGDSPRKRLRPLFDLALQIEQTDADRHAAGRNEAEPWPPEMRRRTHSAGGTVDAELFDLMQSCSI